MNELVSATDEVIFAYIILLILLLINKLIPLMFLSCAFLIHFDKNKIAEIRECKRRERMRNKIKKRK